MTGKGTEDTILFIDIPMVGIWYTKWLLENVMSVRERIAVYHGELNLAQPNADFIRRFRGLDSRPRVVYGHFKFGVHRHLGMEPRYTTIVAEPCRRVVDLFHQLGLDQGTPLHDLIEAGTNLRGLIASHETEMTNNHMCRMLAGWVAVEKIPVFDRACLEEAQRNIRECFLAVGRLEELVHSTMAEIGLCAISKNDPPKPTADSLGLDRATYDLLIKYNQLDIELYQWVQDCMPRVGTAAGADRGVAEVGEEAVETSPGRESGCPATR